MTTVKSGAVDVDRVNMNSIGRRLSSTLACLAGITLLTMHFSCESGPVRPDTPDAAYRFKGVLVKDLNTDFAQIRATLSRNDTTVADGSILFGGDSLAYLPDSTYFRAVLPAGDYPLGVYNIEIRDSSLFHDTLAVGVPDTFSITNVFPDTRIKAGSTVRVEWRGSAAAEGYVIAAAKRDSAYMGVGFSQYVTSQSTSAAYPDSAFAGITGEADIGWYYLYVYAYIGAPDSLLSADLLPVPMPSQLAGNLSVVDLEGRFGTIVVTRFDSMNVDLQY
ncbi:MAG: hypothetical protein AB1744_05990 [Candidatus Zixiibacteriota bacterium]